MRKQSQVPLASLTTFQSPGVIDEVWLVETIEELADLVKQNTPFTILGKGSNTLIDPAHIPTPIIQLSPSLTPIVVEENRLRVGAGVTITRLCAICQKHGLGGLEFVAGVPASVGGMVVMNFGCWGTDVSEHVSRVHIMDEQGDCRWLPASEMEWGYRTSILRHRQWIVLEAEFIVEKGDPDAIQATVKSMIQQRLEKQPLRGKTFGSTFKNPPGISAGELIEKVGLKGHSFGKVKWSDRHGNFLENVSDGTIDDAKHAIEWTRQKVLDETGIALELEVHMMPEWTP